jgi:hypothetical protein
MRRLLLLLPVLVAVGCASGHVDDKQTHAAITELFTRDAVGSPTNPSCAGTLADKTGATVKCTAGDGSGTVWPVTVSVDRIESGQPHVQAAFDSGVVTAAEAEAKITGMYPQIPSHGDVASVDCSGLQKLEVNSVRKCTVHEVGGKTVPVTFQIIQVSGSKYSFEVDPAQ